MATDTAGRAQEFGLETLFAAIFWGTSRYSSPGNTIRTFLRGAKFGSTS